MGGRLNVGFKSRLKLDLFLRSYIYSERGNFAASFYNKNSILMFFPKQSILGGGGALINEMFNTRVFLIANKYHLDEKSKFDLKHDIR